MHKSYPTKIVKSLYRQMLRIRLVEESIAVEYDAQEIRCPVHLCIGQEAIAAGVCENLLPQDVVMSNHRSHGHYLAKGGNLSKMIAEVYGKVTGCSGGRGGSQHLIDLSVNFLGSTPVVGGIIPVATGVAWSSRLQNLQRTVVVFLGDAAVEQGVFHESLNFAALHRLPILYVCENNLYSILTHISERQPHRPIYELVKKHGIYAEQYDGNDIFAVYAAAKKALDYISLGRGPAFLEFLTYRHKEHCGPHDEPEGMRPTREHVKWLRKCPIRRFERFLVRTKYFNKKDMVIIRKQISKEIASAFKFAHQSPYLTEFPASDLSYSDYEK